MDLLYFWIVLLSVLKLGSCKWCHGGSKHLFCETGCCNGQCCVFSTTYIVGGVLGGLILVALIAACLIFICCVCKRKGNRGASVQAYRNTSAIVVYTTSGHPAPAFNQYGYNPTIFSAKPSSYSDPPYPPDVATSLRPPVTATNNTPQGKTYNYYNPSGSAASFNPPPAYHS